MSKAEIVVRFTVEGWHRWPDAPPPRAYLAARHRHVFHVEAGLEVYADDREIEFHDFLDFCRAALPGGEFGGQSCEHLARALLEKITRRYPGRRVLIGIFEDGEVGARVTS
jgi:hypothetical protein